MARIKKARVTSPKTTFGDERRTSDIWQYVLSIARRSAETEKQIEELTMRVVKLEEILRNNKKSS